jgi:hypothetical protein
MPTISHSELAPDEPVRYSLGQAEFQLDGRTKNYETNDPDVLLNAESHPWLVVTYPEVEVIEGAYVEQIAREDDPLSALNSIANDPAEIRKVEEAKRAAFAPVAIDADLNQSEPVTAGVTDVTLEAASEEEAPKRRSTSTQKES